MTLARGTDVGEISRAKRTGLVRRWANQRNTDCEFRGGMRPLDEGMLTAMRPMKTRLRDFSTRLLHSHPDPSPNKNTGRRLRPVKICTLPGVTCSESVLRNAGVLRGISADLVSRVGLPPGRRRDRRSR